MKHTFKKGLHKPTVPVKREKLLKDLQHILSPLEQAALLHHYKPFVYDYDGIALYISRRACKQLMDYASAKTELLTRLIEQERLSTGIPIKHRETFYDPRLIMALPPRLRNRLFSLGCYSLFVIMQKGRRYFEAEQGFSRLAMEKLDGLFGKYGGEGLFK